MFFYDYETTFDNRGWTPSNYDGRHAGPITMRKALGRSLNIPAVKAMYIAGIDTVHDFANQAGVRTELPCEGGCGLASAFGGGAEVRLDELANAYATFSRGGVYMPLTYIDQVFDSEGKLLRQWRQKPERVFKAETAYLLNHMLADEDVRYTEAFNLNPDLNTVAAIKTGTDDNYVNNHIVGYTKSIALGGWIGNHDEAVTFDTERNTTAPKALIIKTFMEAYHQNVAYENRNHWSRPAGIKKVKIDLLTGYQVSDEAEELDEEDQRFSRVDIFPSWYAPKISSGESGRVVEVDSVSGKIADECTPPRAIQTVEAIRISNEIEIDDPFYDGWQESILTGLIENLEIFGYTGAKDDLHKCSDQRPQIRVVEKPEPCSGICPIKIEVQAGTFDLQQINIIHNYQILNEGSIPVEGRSQTITYNYNPFAVNSPLGIRGSLRLEIVDEGLYAQHIDILLEIEGLPRSELPDKDLNLISADIHQGNRVLRIEWSRPGIGLQLHFAEDCSSEPPIYIEDGRTFLETDSIKLPLGNCQIFLIDEDNRESNRLEFEIF